MLGHGDRQGERHRLRDRHRAPRTAPWRPDPSDVQPDVKLRAVQVIEALGSWKDGGGGADRARERVAALDLRPRSSTRRARCCRPRTRPSSRSSTPSTAGSWRTPPA
ncbi:hypothetical protein ACFQ2B_30115 [Streptomyces stramineus]